LPHCEKGSFVRRIKMSAVSLPVTETVIAFTMMVIMAYLLKEKGY
jgi:hypothetical protein